MGITLKKYPSPTDLARAAAEAWVLQLSTRKNAWETPYSVALSGGRITQSFFRELVAHVRLNPAGCARLFDNVHFFWADERCVPPTDPESNFAMARELLFEPLGIVDSRIHRLRGEGPEPTALREAIEGITRAVRVSRGQPVLDMVFLGMGEDGHTASLFPGESLETMNDPAVYRLVRAVKPPPRRLTLGYGVLVAAREAWVLISGEGKEAALKETLSPASPTPLGRVLRMREQSTIYTDVA